MRGETSLCSVQRVVQGLQHCNKQGLIQGEQLYIDQADTGLKHCNDNEVHRTKFIGGLQHAG